MDSGTDTEQEDFVPDKKEEEEDNEQSKSGQQRKSKPKKKGKKQSVKKQKKGKKSPKKKKEKASKSKAKSTTNNNYEEDLQKVKQYMHKQNRPYNLINVYDNLHASIKKSQLQAILDELSANGALTCKQFGNNKIYFLNQSNVEVDEQEIEQIGTKLSSTREQFAEIQVENKQLTEQYRKIVVEPTNQELQSQISDLQRKIEMLVIKKNRLINSVEEKMDEQAVINVEKDEDRLGKKLRKLRKVKKQCIDTWAEILEKKKVEIAQIMGLDI